MNRSEYKFTEREQGRLVVPLGMVLIAGLFFVRYEDGAMVALHYVYVMIPVLVVALFLGRLLSHRSVTRLAQMRDGAERLKEGYFDYLPIEDKNDEFNDISRAFNHMIAIAADREKVQREHTRTLADMNRRMETVLDATNDGIALIDRDGLFTLVNRRFGEMLDTSSEALLYNYVTEAAPLLSSRMANPERLMNVLAPPIDQDMMDPIGISVEVIEIIAGERRFLQMYTAPVRDERSNAAGRIIALHDITRETEVDKMKTEFISVVSHELRTPLTSIKGYTDLLLSEAAGEINELQREFLGILQGSATRLNNLINDILDISRLESGRIEVKSERVNYEKIVGDTIRLMKAAADEKEQSFDASFPGAWPDVRGDSDKITQVLTNLLSNAIKYTPREGWVKISVEVSGASITTCVADSGIGISTEDQKKLFQKFFRADNSSTREAGGTGLGLAIVKMIVELLGGAIWVESDTGKGSRFYFTLPLCNESPNFAGANGVWDSTNASTAEIDIRHSEIEAALAKAAAIEALHEEQFSGSD